MRMQVSPVSNRRYKHRSRSVLSLHVCSFSLKTFFTSSQRAGCVWSWRSAELFILFFFFFSACLTSGCDVTELSASCFSSHTSLMHRGDIQRRQTQRDFISLLLHSDLSQLCWVAALLLVCVRNSFFRLSWTTACSSGSDLQSDRFIVQLMIDGEFVTDLTQNTSDMAAWWATTRVVWSEGVQVSRVQDSCWHWIVLKCKYVKLHKSSC